MFGHVVSGRVACVVPVDFTEAILALLAARSTTDVSVFHELSYFFANKFEVAISDHLCWELAYFDAEIFAVGIGLCWCGGS